MVGNIITRIVMADSDRAGPGGRPTKYTQVLALSICEHIAGGKSLRSFCREEDAPALSSVCLWIVTKPEFSEQYRRAREAAGYAHADDILDMADEVYNGTLEPQSAKVIIDAKKWAAERMAPKAHSPRQEVDHTSTDGSMTPPTRIELVAPDDNGKG